MATFEDEPETEEEVFFGLYLSEVESPSKIILAQERKARRKLYNAIQRRAKRIREDLDDEKPEGFFRHPRFDTGHGYIRFEETISPDVGRAFVFEEFGGDADVLGRVTITSAVRSVAADRQAFGVYEALTTKSRRTASEKGETTTTVGPTCFHRNPYSHTTYEDLDFRSGVLVDDWRPIIGDRWDQFGVRRELEGLAGKLESLTPALRISPDDATDIRKFYR